MLGFYILAVSISLGLIYIPYAQWRYSQQANTHVAIFCAVGAIVILYSIVPRPDRFTDPGPRLIPEEHPALFQEIATIATATGQKMPSEVYLLNEVNAWVAQRGGFMGIGSRRVMGIGLPLLDALTLSQFQAVLVHEFGHYYGGDTKLGPWIYKTRAAISRTVDELAWQAENLGKPYLSALQKPFELYGNMFLRVTKAISRKQEFSADFLAARISGPEALTQGLQAIHGAALAYDAYFFNELIPLLRAGYRAPIIEGLRHFTGASEIAKGIDQGTKEELQSARTDLYDSHPPLQERIAAVAHLPRKNGPADTKSALSLISNVEELEVRLISFITRLEDSTRFKRVAWEDVADCVLLPEWVEWMTPHAKYLQQITIKSLSNLSRQMHQYSADFGRGETINERHEYVCAVLGAALVVTLKNKGWKLRAFPGEPVQLVLGKQIIEPFVAVAQLNRREFDAGMWEAFCMESEIADLQLMEVKVPFVQAAITDPTPI